MFDFITRSIVKTQRANEIKVCLLESSLNEKLVNGELRGNAHLLKNQTNKNSKKGSKNYGRYNRR